MNYATQPIPFPARFDYGSRVGRPTLALVFHMAEGTNVAQFLSRLPARGVSVHYTIEQRTTEWADGEVVRCLPERRIAGSIDPDTIRRDNDADGSYGARFAKASLGQFWLNPNGYVLSCEVAGKASEGPTAAQVDSMVDLYEDCERRYDGLDVLGHRDFQNVKMCPGKSPTMRAAFTRMGRTLGGKRYMSTRGFVPGQVCDVRDGARLYDYPGAPTSIGTVDPPLDRAFLGWSPGKREHALIGTDLGSGRTAWVKTANVSNVRPDASPDLEAARAAGRIEGLDEAEGAVAALPR